MPQMTIKEIITMPTSITEVPQGASGVKEKP